ncbi:A disintegrin and metalloproteinase with thrombospondin motifs 16-like [Oculina patagonica]
MHHSLCGWSVFILLALLKFTCSDAVIVRESKKNLHHHMTKREIEYYFGVKDHSEIPEYDVSTPRQTEANGRTVSRFRRRRSVDHPDVLHYNLHAFGSKLQLRLKRNLKLMAPNMVIERHHKGGLVTTQPAPRNKYYLGKVSSDADSLVALRSDKGLSGMIRTSDDLLFVQPLPAHLAKRVRRSADTTPHLVYRLSPGKTAAPGCQTKTSGDDRSKRSTHERKIRDTTKDTDVYKYLEGALIVPKSYEEKYGKDKFATVLLVIANLISGMYQDPSIGDIKVYYVVSKIIVLESTQEQAGFSAGDSNDAKLTKMVRWTAASLSKADKDPDHYDVFSYVSNKIPAGGLANVNVMCSSGNGNVQADLGLQSALQIAHEIGHNFNLGHDNDEGCHSNSYIMAASLPGGVYAALWSNCSREDMQKFLGNEARSWCLKDPPTQYPLPALSPVYQGKQPGQIFSGDDQCEFQYGSGWHMSPHQKGVCGTLYCFKDGTQLSLNAPVVDGSPCGVRKWCIGGKCVDNGRPRIHGGWSAWPSVYSSCTRPCGGGVQYRTRVCRNPVPSNGGSPCVGTNKQRRICNSQPCPEGSNTFRVEQCLQKQGTPPFYQKKNPCSLWCRSGSTAIHHGDVEDGTRCTLDLSDLDVCVQGSCRRVGCDHVLDSDSMDDRCGKCGGDGDTCFIVRGNYTTAHTEKGPEKADLIVRLPVGAFNVVFLMRKATNNYLGVQADNGTYLVGGKTSSEKQLVLAANTSITYTRKKNKFKDLLQITGPTNTFLKVMYVAVKGGNPGLDYSFKRPVKPSETPPERKFEWDVTPWSACSTTCGQGVKTRTARCIRSDDKTPASDRACGKKESTSEPCQVTPCPSNWYQTPWSDCSQSCGRGVQTRNVICRMKINPTEYGPSTNCSAEDKPNITETSRYCNSIACLSDWDTKDGFVRDKCGKPFKKNELKCYHMDQFGEKSRIPNLLCRYREKPTRLPCTTPSPPTTPTTPTPTQGNKADADKKARGSQSIQAQSSVFLAFLIPLLQILL